MAIDFAERSWYVPYAIRALMLKQRVDTVDYGQLDMLRTSHPAWRLLTAQNTALIVSFLHRVFVVSNARSVAQADLIAKLDDYLFHLRRELGEDKFPRSANAYLDDWASDKNGWLRKYYTADHDEPLYDLAPATEQAIGWLDSLVGRDFIGTESRLITIIQLLRRLVRSTETDANARIRNLQHRRAEIDAEIARIEAGHIDILDDASVRDRFREVVATARSLLSDFRAVEQNFRDLDRSVRERIAMWEGNKGELLEDIFSVRDAISDSDQGRSFRGFWELLMSEAKHEELEQMLQTVFELEAVQALSPDRRILRIHYDWIAAGEVTQRTVAQLSAELRRYLDDKVWLENRRIMEILRGIEQSALQVRDAAPRDAFVEIDSIVPDIGLTMDRPLFTPPHKPDIDDDITLAIGDDIPADALFDQVHVDKTRLVGFVRHALQRANQVALCDVVAAHPLEQGLAELVAYLSIAADDGCAVIDESRQQTVHWTDASGVVREATMPVVIFSRAGSVSTSARNDQPNDTSSGDGAP